MTNVWIDRSGKRHLLIEMSEFYLRNVKNLLEREVDKLQQLNDLDNDGDMNFSHHLRISNEVDRLTKILNSIKKEIIKRIKK